MRRITIAASLAALAAIAPGCSRKATLMQEQSGASTVPPDSTIAMIRDAQAAWDSQSDDRAASLTLGAVQLDLTGRPSGAWRTRTEDLLDSLGVGVETAGTGCAMMVNVFVRADPNRGSWPALFWCDGPNVRWQEMEGHGLKLLGMASLGTSDSSGTKAPLKVASLFGRTRVGRQEPLLMVWSRRTKDRGWKLSQTLGPDSLGGFGTGAFESSADTSVDLVTRTFTNTRGFDECNTCPHMMREHRFHWRPYGFERTSDHLIPSTYATFVRLIGDLQQSSAEAPTLVTDPALIELANKYEWNHTKGIWRIAPGTEEAGSVLTFFRGGQEAYRVTFEPRGDDWVINGIQPVPRSVE